MMYYQQDHSCRRENQNFALQQMQKKSFCMVHGGFNQQWKERRTTWAFPWEIILQIFIPQCNLMLCIFPSSTTVWYILINVQQKGFLVPNAFTTSLSGSQKLTGNWLHNTRNFDLVILYGHLGLQTLAIICIEYTQQIIHLACFKVAEMDEQQTPFPDK